MNPDLQKLWQNVLQANSAAKAAGDSLTSDDIDQYLQGASGGKFGLKDITAVNLRNLGRSFTQGATMNFADELAGGKAAPADLAAVEGAGNAAVPGMGTAMAVGRDVLGKISAAMGGSPAVREDMRLRGRLFHEAHPKTDIVANMAGSTLPMLAIPGGEAATTLQGVVRGAVTGAGVGSLAGAGAGEDAASRLSNAAVGGVTGGVMGAAIPAVVGAVRYVRDPAVRVRGLLMNALKESGGGPGLEAEIARYTAAGKGDLPALADMSPAFRALADRAATASPAARAAIEDFASTRQKGMSERLMADVGKAAPDMADANATHTFDVLKDDTQDWARKAYNELEQLHPRVPNTTLPSKGQDAAQQIYEMAKGAISENPSPAAAAALERLNPAANQSPSEMQFAQILSKPKVSDALRAAQNAGLIKEMPTPAEAPTLRKLISVKDKVDGLATRAFKSGDGYLGNALAEARNEIDQHLVENVPGYSAVTAEYAKRMGLSRTLQDGMDAWGAQDTAGLEKMVSQMDPDQLHMFRTGLASELLSKLRNAETNRDVAHRLLDASIAKDAKLRVLFGSQQNFDTFMKMADLEAEMAKLRGTYTGSATARRTAAAATDPADVALAGATSGLAGGLHLAKSMATRLLARTARHALNQETANAMMPQLLTRGTPAIDNMLQSLLHPAPAMGAGLTTLAPGAASVGLVDALQRP